MPSRSAALYHKNYGLLYVLTFFLHIFLLHNTSIFIYIKNLMRGTRITTLSSSSWTLYLSNQLVSCSFLMSSVKPPISYVQKLRYYHLLLFLNDFLHTSQGHIQDNGDEHDYDTTVHIGPLCLLEHISGNFEGHFPGFCCQHIRKCITHKIFYSYEIIEIAPMNWNPFFI